MTPEERNAMVQFMGTMHAQAKQQDQMIVGQSNYVKPVSNDVKAALEASLSQPVSGPITTPQPVAPAAAVSPEQAARELAQTQHEPLPTPVDIPQASELPFVDPNQMEFDLTEPSKLDRITELLEKQNRILLDIRDNGIKLKHDAERTKNSKKR